MHRTGRTRHCDSRILACRDNCLQNKRSYIIDYMPFGRTPSNHRDVRATRLCATPVSWLGDSTPEDDTAATSRNEGPSGSAAGHHSLRPDTLQHRAAHISRHRVGVERKVMHIVECAGCASGDPGSSVSARLTRIGRRQSMGGDSRRCKGARWVDDRDRTVEEWRHDGGRAGLVVPREHAEDNEAEGAT